MDANRASSDHRWTNERHLHFLKSVEASFVRTMLENADGHVPLQMDRYLPDSCESTTTTAATGTKRRRKHFPEDNLDLNKRIDRRLRLRLSSPPHDDQVVPDIKTGDDDCKSASREVCDEEVKW